MHDAFDSLTAVHMLNFGPGYHGWQGYYSANFAGCVSPEYLFRGSVSEDGSEHYMEIIWMLVILTTDIGITALEIALGMRCGILDLRQ